MDGLYDDPNDEIPIGPTDFDDPATASKAGDDDLE
jgi:hypothetical protein